MFCIFAVPTTTTTTTTTTTSYSQGSHYRAKMESRPSKTRKTKHTGKTTQHQSYDHSKPPRIKKGERKKKDLTAQKFGEKAGAEG